MRAGELRTRAKVLSPSRINTDGEVTIVWPVIATVWISLWPTSASERRLSQSQTGLQQYEIRMRCSACPSFASEMRIKVGQRLFSIDGYIDVDSKGELYRIWATETQKPTTVVNPPA